MRAPVDGVWKKEGVADRLARQTLYHRAKFQTPQSIHFISTFFLIYFQFSIYWFSLPPLLG